MNNTNLKLPKRLENAVTKLYKAFHNDELNAMDCRACAVGNMCDNTDRWIVTYDDYKSINTGYSPEELFNIEYLFMNGTIPNGKGWFDSKGLSLSINSGWSAGEVNKKNKDLVFFSLTKVIEYLCQLDNVPNIMQVQSLFDYDENGAKNKISEAIAS